MDDTRTRRYCWYPEVAGHLDGVGDLFRSRLSSGMWSIQVPAYARITEDRAAEVACGNTCTNREEIEGLAA